MKTNEVQDIALTPEIDRVLSGTGLPRGVITELSGPDGSGKTTLAFLLGAAAQKMGLKVGYIDVEYALRRAKQREHAKFLGFDVDKVDFGGYKPTAEEQASEIMRMCTEHYGLVILDSVAGLLPAAKIERMERQLEDEEFGSNSGGQFGRVAAFLSETLPFITREAALGDTALLFINQMRANIPKARGPFAAMGPKELPYGGYALKHFSFIRAEIRRVAWIKYSTKVIGFRAKVVCPWKNRFVPPQQQAFIDLIFDHEAPSMDELNKRKKNKISAVTVTPIKPEEET